MDAKGEDVEEEERREVLPEEKGSGDADVDTEELGYEPDVDSIIFATVCVFVLFIKGVL